jgi:DNA-binding transcriptional ArsR family regulator
MPKTPDVRLRALAHPVRLRMLSLLWAAPNSAAGLARQLGIGHGLASQHLRVLEQAGYVELAAVRKKRGGQERLFQALRGTPLSDGAASGEFTLLVRAMVDVVTARIPERRADDAPLVVDAELWVRPEDWQQARRDLRAGVDALHEAALPPHSEGTERVSLSLIGLALSDPPRQHPSSS